MQKYIASIFLLALVSSASAFTSSPQPWGRRRSDRFMFSTDENEASNTAISTPPPVAQPLATMEETLGSSATQIVTSTPVERPKTLARNMNTGEVVEVKWVDPAMGAHTNPLQMDWWAYILFGFPFVLLANDALHFLPEEGPLSFLQVF